MALIFHNLIGFLIEFGFSKTELITLGFGGVFWGVLVGAGGVGLDVGCWLDPGIFLQLEFKQFK